MDICYLSSSDLSISMLQWRSAGFNVLPLPANSKRCRLDNWQVADVNELWRDVGTDFNIAVRFGGSTRNVAVADGDSPRSVAHIADALRGLGAAFLCTTTATAGHVHFWLNVTGTPEGAYRKLSAEVGAGELRYGSGAYVVVPASRIDGRAYRFVHDMDTPLTIAGLRSVRYADLARVLLPVERPQPQERPALPRDAGLVRGKLPLDVLVMLDTLADAPRGQQVGKYASRSEGEFAVVLSCINYGWTLDEVRELFDCHHPGHYADYRTPRAKERYLALTFSRAMAVYAGTPVRQELATAIASVPSCWPGRGGGLEQSTYRALLQVAYTANALTFGASERQLSELAGASRVGVHNALDRLQRAGLVERTGLDADWHTSLWVVNLGGVNKLPFLHSCATVDGLYASELWTAMGRSSGMLYGLLDAKSGAKVAFLAEKSGKCKNTVKTALAKLERYGLAQRGDAGWTRGSRDVQDVARELDCAGRAARRRERHDAERRAYRGQKSRSSSSEVRSE